MINIVEILLPFCPCECQTTQRRDLQGICIYLYDFKLRQWKPPIFFIQIHVQIISAKKTNFQFQFHTIKHIYPPLDADYSDTIVN